MPLLPNVLLTTGRGTYNATTGITSSDATPYLSGVLACVMPDQESTLFALQAGLFEQHYHGWVDTGTDIAMNDQLMAITGLDGVTPWPADGSSGNTVWRIAYHNETASGFIPQRYLHIVRTRAGGTAH